MTGGMIQGGWGFVWLAYGLTWSVLLAYIIYLWQMGKDI